MGARSATQRVKLHHPSEVTGIIVTECVLVIVLNADQVSINIRLLRDESQSKCIQNE